MNATWYMSIIVDGMAIDYKLWPYELHDFLPME